MASSAVCGRDYHLTSASIHIAFAQSVSPSSHFCAVQSLLLVALLLHVRRRVKLQDKAPTGLTGALFLSNQVRRHSIKTATVHREEQGKAVRTTTGAVTTAGIRSSNTSSSIIR